jgi:hypothetical protein
MADGRVGQRPRNDVAAGLPKESQVQGVVRYSRVSAFRVEGGVQSSLKESGGFVALG